MKSRALLPLFLLILLAACSARPTAPAPTAAPTDPPTAAINPTPDAPQPTVAPTRLTVTLLPDDTDSMITEHPTLASAPVYDPLELDLIARINEYRIQNGVWPLAPNSDLRKLAVSQALYLHTLPELPTGYNFHLGPEGDDPALRALKSGWPTYNTTAQIAVGENAYVGATFDSAMAYWRTSEIHNKTMLNSAFREIGIGFSDEGGYKLMIVFFGGRPDVLPALYDPYSARLFLSSERYKWSAGGTWIHDVTQVALAEDPAPADAFTAWQLATTLPADSERLYNITYSDGSDTLAAQINPHADIAWLPQNLYINDAAIAGTSPESTPNPVEPAAPNLQITYDALSLSLTSLSDSPLDLTGVELAGSGLRLPLTLWGGDEIAALLASFPAHSCLQVWSAATTDTRIAPNGCQTRHRLIYLPTDQLFWQQADFTLRQNGQDLTTCTPTAGICQATIP